MDDVRPDKALTRRSALMFAAAASPLLAKAESATPELDDKPTGRPVVFFEIGCKDLTKTSQYFSSLFGWKMQPSALAATIETGSQAGISGHMVSLGHEPFHYTIFYVEVDDVKASLDKAVELGGKAVVGPVKFPGGTFAWFNDPEGNMIGLLKPAR